MSASGPMALWRARVAEGRIAHDPGQALAVEKLQLLHRRLSGYAPPRRRKRGFQLFGRGDAVGHEGPEGLYLYGGVGRGKSMLMDLFFENAPLTPKRRVHFHGFMQEAQAGIHAARESGVDDPIRVVAQEVAETAALLCFDEMEVRDIADAMILGRLFESLFTRGVVVVATSNRHPDELYKDGLNRQLFLPFIQKLKTRLDVYEIPGGADYRSRDVLPHWVSPLNAATEARMDEIWRALRGASDEQAREVAVAGRRIAVHRAAGHAARFSFAELCDRPLGVADYLALEAAFNCFMIEGVPLLGRHAANPTRRFVLLIDTLYEARAGIFCSAAAAPDGLCAEGDWAFEFARTASRLTEMTAPGWPPDDPA